MPMFGNYDMNAAVANERANINAGAQLFKMCFLAAVRKGSDKNVTLENLARVHNDRAIARKLLVVFHYDKLGKTFPELKLIE